MLTTISEQSQLLSPKKLLALQRQIPISENQQQRLMFGTCIGKSSITEDTPHPLNARGLASDSSASSVKKRDNDKSSMDVTPNASIVDSNQLIEENCHHEGHKNIYPAVGEASVGKQK